MVDYKHEKMPLLGEKIVQFMGVFGREAHKVPDDVFTDDVIVRWAVMEWLDTGVIRIFDLLSLFHDPVFPPDFDDLGLFESVTDAERSFLSTVIATERFEHLLGYYTDRCREIRGGGIDD
ncbi:hypothetical protein TH8_19670 [Thalassospira profundimaris]|nr:hypothetical protein TH8_19670 [Thalassospira profundimaris]